MWSYVRKLSVSSPRRGRDFRVRGTNIHLYKFRIARSGGKTIDFLVSEAVNQFIGCGVVFRSKNRLKIEISVSRYFFIVSSRGLSFCSHLLRIG
jgi:hypothetical protein